MHEPFSAIPGIIVFGITIFLIISAILAIFIPFWIWRIRNEVIVMNQTLKQILASNRKVAQTSKKDIPSSPAITKV